ncbi:MAG: hypothetical protein DBX60_00620, partial [Bacillota bacterium]
PPSNSPQKNTSSFFGDPEEGGKDGTGLPQRFAKQRFFGEFCRVPEKIAQRVLWEVIYGAPAKIFAKQKDFWEKEEQALKTWCLPSGKYPKRALKMGPPQRFLRSKKICGERSGGR